MIARTGHRLYVIIAWFTIILALLKCVSSELPEDAMCTLQNPGRVGRCKLVSKCPKAVEDLRQQNIFPQTCGFEGNQPIVCCDETPIIEDHAFREGFIAEETISRQKCKEYYEQYDKQISRHRVVSLVNDVPDDPYVQESCVQHTVPLIVQGNQARPKEFPHMAAIGYDEGQNKSWLCSGVLISENFVLTSAHCLSSRLSGAPKYIRLGDLALDRRDDDSDLQEFNVTEIFRHPDFKPPSVYNDIGLLKLDNFVKFTSYVRPACLYSNSFLPSSKPIATSWADDIGTQLLKTTLQFSSHSQCQTAYKDDSKTRLKQGIVDRTQVCAGTSSRKDICMSVGGALVSYNEGEYCMYDVLGIMSFGRSCGISGLPDVFTRVSAYIPWIEGIVWPS